MICWVPHEADTLRPRFGVQLHRQDKPCILCRRSRPARDHRQWRPHFGSIDSNSTVAPDFLVLHYLNRVFRVLIRDAKREVKLARLLYCVRTKNMQLPDP